VGLASRAEWLNLFTRRAFDPEDLGRRVGAALPLGLAVERVEVLDMARRQPQPQLEDFEARPGPGAGSHDWLAAWRAFAAADRFPVAKDPAKSPVDARPMVTAIDVADDGLVRFSCDWTGGYLSPLLLARAVAGEAVELTKTAQRFAPTPA